MGNKTESTNTIDINSSTCMIRDLSEISRGEEGGEGGRGGRGREGERGGEGVGILNLGLEMR